MFREKVVYYTPAGNRRAVVPALRNTYALIKVRIMTLLSTLFVISAIGVLLFGGLKIWSDIQTRNKMTKKEAKLRKKGVSPFGSTLAHGMVYNKKTGKIQPDQKESITWYRRLIN